MTTRPANGKVYAIDVDPDMTDYLRDRATSEARTNVEVVLASESDPKLPADGVDLVSTSNTYHHLSDRTAYFARIAPSLRPGGRVAIVEHAPSGWFGRLFGHATEAATIRSEMATAGYRVAIDHPLPRQSFLVFEVDSR
jgi:SAM-dependent methyltransferase